MPTVTAVNDAFTVAPDTYNQLNVVANDINSTGGGVQVASVGPVSPSGPSLTQLSTGDLAFSSAYTGTYTFNYTATDQAQPLTANDGAVNDNFGYSVAVSGNTVAIGACYHTSGSGGSDEGAVYVFTLSGSTWVLQQELTNAGDFGYSVALDGNTLLVGAINAGQTSTDDDGDVFGEGAAFVYTHSGSTWTEQQELLAPDGAIGDEFGNRVTISDNTLVVTAPAHMVGGTTAQGAAYVYALSGSTWSLQQELTAVDGTTADSFGSSVSISGGILVVGVGSSSDPGAAYVYAQSGSTWDLQQEITAPSGPYSDFGGSVSVSGGTLVVGASEATVGSNAYAGAAYVYTQSGSTWSLQQVLTASDGSEFGSSVSLDGNAVAIGDWTTEKAYVFTYNGTTWTQQQELVDPVSNSLDEFGSAVALNGSTLAIGAPNTSVGSNGGQGAAQIMDRTQLSTAT